MRTAITHDASYHANAKLGILCRSKPLAGIEWVTLAILSRFIWMSISYSMLTALITSLSLV